MYKSQRGLSTIGWALVLCIVIFFGLFAKTVVPAYNESFYVKSALKSLAENNSNLSELSRSEVMSQLNKFAVVNQLSKTVMDGFEVKSYKTSFVVNSVYEVREPLFYNIDLVITFKRQLNAMTPEICCPYVIDEWDEKKPSD